MAPKKNKLKPFGKHGRESRVSGKTTYDADGNWVATQHQDSLRQLENPLFDRYFGELQRLGGLMMPPSAEPSAEDVMLAWKKEVAMLRTPLPTTLWINDTDPMAPAVRFFMEEQQRKQPHLVEPIDWYPLEGMAWRILADKTQFRKIEELKELRQFLIRQTALGTISRQEEVSMIPPFLLDIQPTDRCLDMCASPGSKTAQMLVALGRHKTVPVDSMASPFPFDYASDGLVVANELDSKRANMLVHQVKRMRLLFPFALFTNHDARYFPDMELANPTQEGGESEPMRFDKILCDVVCSGDGTIRKAPHIFKIWTPREAMNLQKLQIQIAMRACHLLKVGGRLVYSTCSLNPVEDEAVVVQLIHRTKGAMRLVSVRDRLPNLRCAPGLQTWTVTDAKGKIVEQPEGNMHEALFPPHTPGGYHSPAVDEVDLRHCMRLLPSHCNGGGFFIAVLEKLAEFRQTRQEVEAESETTDSGAKRAREEVPDATSAVEDGGEPPAKKAKSVPPQFVAVPEAIHNTLRNFYEIPNFPMEYLVVRTATGEREARLTPSSTCSIVSKEARKVLQHKTDALLVVSAGLRVIAHETLDGGWRIVSESASLFSKLMVASNSSRVVTVPVSLVEDLILRGGKLKQMLLEDIQDPALKAKMESLSLGTVLVAIDAPGAVGGKLYSVILRARSRIQLLVDHEEITGLQLRLGLEPQDPLPEEERAVNGAAQENTAE